MDITLTIPDNQVSRIVDAMTGLFPIPQDTEGVKEFTDSQWAKEKVRRWIIEQVKRWENYVAREAVDIQPDNELVS